VLADSFRFQKPNAKPETISGNRMKTTTNILTSVFMTFLLACGQTANQDKNTHANNDTIQRIDTAKQLTKEEKQKQILEEERIDSLRLDIALKDAFKVAQTEFKTDNFKKEYEIQPDDSSYKIRIEIVIGRLFENNQKYFLLRRHVPWATYLDLFQIDDNETVKQIETEVGVMPYPSDTIFDVNGDGRKDFLVHWYPPSGCCRRDFYDVYLKKTDKGGFTEAYEFINPTFSAEEGIIRGVLYGHPGQVGLYKYKWSGLQVDTLEFIFPDALVSGQFIKTKKWAYRPTEKDGVVLKAVPQEYLNIESYEWFADLDTGEKASVTKKRGNSKYYTISETLLIPTETGDTLKFSKESFNRIVDEHPELYQDLVYNPDFLYHAHVDKGDFDSEQGQDVYYVLYAYFLKQKNGITKFKAQRKKLINIFSNLNSLFSHFQYGGTFFGHQQLRILGYAEYSIYLYPKNSNDFEKTYDITKQKELYIKSLRQLIRDESTIDFETLGNEKIERIRKLDKIVDELSSLITDIFYLRRAQAFQYGNYEYY